MYYHTLNEELRRRFGCKVYKLALDGGFTCPNRDGAIGTRGCIFCAGDGSGAFVADRALDIPEQIEAAKARVAGKNGSGKYIAYFQNFTNTYGSLARMERLFTQALAARLEQAGVRFYWNTRIQSLRRTGAQIEALEVIDSTGTTASLRADADGRTWKPTMMAFEAAANRTSDSEI